MEFYHAIKDSTTTTLPLIANWSGTRLYDANYGWGRLWHWFYRVSQYFTNGDSRLPPLKKAILHTHALFLSQITLISPFLDHYQHYLKQVSEDYAVKERDYKIARKKISALSTSTRPFIKLINSLHLKNNRVENLLNYCFSKKQRVNLFQSPVLSKIDNLRYIIDLEGESGGCLPLISLKKKLKGKILNKIDHEEIDHWVRKINQSGIAVSTLHRGLKGIDNEMQTNNVTSLELLLQTKNCHLFTQPDPEQVAWRQRLHKQKKISYNESILTLDAEISPSLAKNDQTHIFEIKEEPHTVALIPNNRAILNIRHQEQQKEESTTHKKYKIEYAKFLDIASNGRMARMERLQPLDHYPWKSEQQLINAYDAPLVKNLISFLRSMITQNSTPVGFSFASIMCDHNRQLKSLKPLINGPFDFNAIEDFIKYCAGGNKTIFYHLMVQSGLNTHPTAIFYYELIKNALDGDTTHIDDLAGIYQISDPKVIDRGSKLIAEAFILQRKLCSDSRIPKEKINETILANHRATGAVSLLLSPAIAKDCYHEVVT